MTIFIEVGRDKRSSLRVGLFEMVSLLLPRFLDTGLPGNRIFEAELFFFKVIIQGPETKSSPGGGCPIKAVVS